MEVDGKEFLRNVGIEQDKERLAQEQKRLEALKREAYLREEAEKVPSEEEAAFVDLAINSSSTKAPMDEQPTIEDIKLEQDDPNRAKKRYILLGIALVLVFVITILVIRILSNNDTEQKMENLNPQQQDLSTDKILNKIDTNEEYQKAIEKNLAKEESRKLDEAKKSKEPEVSLGTENIENTPLLIEKPKTQEKPEKDLFGLDKTKEELEAKVEQPKKAIADIYKRIEESDKKREEESIFEKTVTKATPPPKKEVKPVVREKSTSKVAPVAKSSSKVSGYYIQIGAFTKQPNKKLLNEITANGFDYVIHPMIIKGTKYNKVLIGAYPTRKTASNNLNDVKQKLKKPGAYILKF